MKLYIDDLRKCPEGWVLARTVTEAIRLLANQAVEEVSLDHDISHRINMDSIARPFPCQETFEPVAWYLAAAKFSGPVTLHTANPIGARKMEAILTEAGIESRTILGQPVNGLE
jgi:hypothetical protein